MKHECRITAARCLTFVLMFFAIHLSVDPAAAQGLKPSRQYIDSVNQALSSKSDVWGEEELSKPNGPTFDGLKDRLNPLMHLFTWYSENEIYYLPFGMQDGTLGGRDYALHYADGGQIVSRRAEIPPALIPANAPWYAGKRLTIFVGESGMERYGSDLARLPMPTLGDGYLPILQTKYTDVNGLQYSQESFAVRLPDSKDLLSFVKLTVRGNGQMQKAKVRLQFAYVTRTKPPTIEDEIGLKLASVNRVVDGNDRTYLVFGGGTATMNGSDLTLALDLKGSEEKTIFLIRPNSPAESQVPKPDRAGYSRARKFLADYWNRKLAGASQFDVPEPYVMDAQKNLLIQNLLMNLLYSIGNPYEVRYNAEGHDSIQSLGYFGYFDEYKAGLNAFLTRQSHNYEKGERLLHAADYYFLTRDKTFIQRHDRTYKHFVSDFLAEMTANNGLLRKEPGGTDISGETLHYNVNHQSVAWRGWRDMAAVWAALGQSDFVNRFTPKLKELQTTIVKEAIASAYRYPDGSLYIPNQVRGKGDSGPFDFITETKEGSYWLLVATDGFAAGPYSSAENKAILKYIHNYGGTMMGMIRFNYVSTPVGGCARNGLPGYEVHGVDNAYAPPYLKLLAENGERDRLVLSFYGKLAHGMTRNTFLAGEGESIGVCEDPHFVSGTATKYYRTLYLPPNSTNNSAFLLALRYMLVRESQDDAGNPKDLYLADATPRIWLENGKRIRVKDAPTYFGPLSYSIDSQLQRGFIDAEIDIPSRNTIQEITLRLRVPEGYGMKKLLMNQMPYDRFDANEETVNLSGQSGNLKLRVFYERVSHGHAAGR